MTETLVVHSRKLAIYLQCRGFLLVGVEPDLKSNNRKVFIFNDSDAIRRAMIQYKNDKSFHAFLAQMAEGR
ncbi:DUF5659 domain-containing protein [Parageobacillus thermoglucosidasius]|uniref:DUF5659 domain-containing protein n=1 Tax=Parageobacillus thermoglucosidasius TaxID=1426 RepID=UPI003D2DF20F